jgi:hypothetical protein
LPDKQHGQKRNYTIHLGEYCRPRFEPPVPHAFFSNAKVSHRTVLVDIKCPGCPGFEMQQPLPLFADGETDSQGRGEFSEINCVGLQLMRHD